MFFQSFQIYWLKELVLKVRQMIDNIFNLQQLYRIIYNLWSGSIFHLQALIKSEALAHIARLQNF